MKKKDRNIPRDDTRGQLRRTLGSYLNFGAAESYKLLRTNLLYTLTDSESACKVIGITSSLRNEGKSTTAINLAYSFSETGSRVLLIEMDMRLPCFAKRLSLYFKPGLSSILVDSSSVDTAVQTSRYTGNLQILVSGDIPPNPAELLGSKRIKSLFDELRESYDYIICDLPPINIVSDGLVAQSFIDGYVFVVRQDFCNQSDLAEAMHRMELLNINILGFALTRANASRRYDRYGRYGKYGKYGSSYGYGYGRRSSVSAGKSSATPAADSTAPQEQLSKPENDKVTETP